MIKKYFYLLLIFVQNIAWASLADSTQISQGQSLFESNCTACHNFNTDGIGPQLAGLQGVIKPDWMLSFIKSPQAKIDQKDARAMVLQKKYKTTMPNFDYLTDTEIESIVAFIMTKKAVGKSNSKNNLAELSDPIPTKVKLSDMVVNMVPFTEIPHSSRSDLHTRIVKMDFNPSTKEEFVLDLNGKLYKLNSENKPETYLDMAKHMPNFINVPGLATGFGSFAFHPEFAKNGLLYTTHTEKAGSAKADFAGNDSVKVALQWVVSEWKSKNINAIPFQGVQRELFRVNMVSQIHGVQEIAFNPYSKPGSDDYGLLYIGVGDGGCVENGYPDMANNKKNIWGNMVRIDPQGRNSKNGKYGIPQSNPLNGKTDLKEIYAMGFRNPHRFSWTKDGKLLVSNIGQKNIESVSVTLPGHNYGWPMREGTFMIDKYDDINKVYPLPNDDKKYNFTYPVIQLDHDETIAISGGYEYTGRKISQLKGKYVFGSVADGRLFYTEMKDLQNGKQAEVKEWKVAFKGKIIPFSELAGNQRIDLRLGKDAEGELYILTKPDGKIYKLSN